MTIKAKINQKQTLSAKLNNAIEYVYPDLQEKEATPSGIVQEVTADEPYYGLSKVTVNAVELEEITIDPSTDDRVFFSDYSGFSKITANRMSLQEKSIKVSADDGEVVVTPDSKYHGLKNVKVSAKGETDLPLAFQLADEELVSRDNEVTGEYENSGAYIFNDLNDTVTISRNTTQKLKLYFSDGEYSEIVSGSGYTKTWDKSKDIEGYRYVVVIGKEPITVSLSNASNARCLEYAIFRKIFQQLGMSETHSNSAPLKHIKVHEGVAIYKIPNFVLSVEYVGEETLIKSGNFYDFVPYNQKRIGNFVLNVPVINSWGASNYYNLEKVGYIDCSSLITNITDAFGKMYQLREFGGFRNCKVSITVSSITPLSAQSVANIVHELPVLEVTKNLNLGSVHLYKHLTDELKAELTAKNWTYTVY